VLVPLSLLIEAPDEASFAFQLAHAMSHIALRHATRQATRLELQNLGMMAVRANTTAVAAKAIDSTEALAAQAAFYTFARRFELEADELALGILANAGYDPESVISYLQPQPAATTARSSGVSRVFSAHPATARRLEVMLVKMNQLPDRLYTVQSSHFDRIQAIARSMR
jgi:predicted Zn-dependent protease